MSRELADFPFRPRNLYAGSPVLAMDSAEGATVADTTEQVNVTSTSFIPWDPEITTLFVAPTSGRVVVIIACRFDEDGGGSNRAVAAPQIKKSDRNGPVVKAPGIAANSCSSASVDAPLFQAVCRLTVVDGLVPGHTYWAQVMVLVSGGASLDMNNARLYIIPAQ